MPLNLLIYSRFLTSDPSFTPSDISYKTLAAGLLLIVVPVCIGMALIAKAQKVTLKIKKFVQLFVLLLVVLLVGLGNSSLPPFVT